MSSQAMECLKLSDYQVKVLEENFNRVSKHPDGTTLMLIAAECGLSEEETQVRRTAERLKYLEIQITTPDTYYGTFLKTCITSICVVTD